MRTKTREAATPEPLRASPPRTRTLAQPETVSDAQTLIRIELQARERDVVHVPTFDDPETRSYSRRVATFRDFDASGNARVREGTGFTGHVPRTRAVPKLRAPRPEDAEPEGTAVDAPGGGLRETKRQNCAASKRLTARFGLDGKDEVKEAIRNAQVQDQESSSRGARAPAGYTGFRSRLGPSEHKASPPRADVVGTPPRDQSQTQRTSRRPGQTQSAHVPPSANYYVPSLTLPPPERSGDNEERYHVPGYAGHVKGGSFKFGNTFGDVSRHQLTKPEMQSEAFQPPTARGHIGRGVEHLAGQYFKLPNKLGAINRYGAAQSANCAVVQPLGGTGAVTSNRNVTRERSPEATEYPLWCSPKPLKVLPPPLDPTLGTTLGLEDAAKQMAPRPPPVEIEPDSAEERTRRAMSIGTVRIRRNDARNRTGIVQDMAGKKDERVQQTMEATFEARRRHMHALDLDAKPPLKSRKVKEAEARAWSEAVFDRPISPRATGHLPGYAGHVNKDQVNFGRTLAARSKKNYNDPFGVGHGTRSGMDDDGATATARSGPVENIATRKMSARGRREADFDDDARIAAEFPRNRALVKAGRTHVPFDPAFHSDSRGNVITNGRGGYPKAPKEPPQQTESRYHVPGYTGHVEKVKFKFGNGYSDTTQHVLTKDGKPENRSVPFLATRGEARPEYGFLKLPNKIEGKNPANITQRPMDLSGSYRGHRSAVLSGVRVTSSTSRSEA